MTKLVKADYFIGLHKGFVYFMQNEFWSDFEANDDRSKHFNPDDMFKGAKTKLSLQKVNIDFNVVTTIDV